MLKARFYNHKDNKYVGIEELYSFREDDNHGQIPKGYSDDEGWAAGDMNDICIEPLSNCYDSNSVPLYVGDIVTRPDKYKDGTKFEVVLAYFPALSICLKNLKYDDSNDLRPAPSLMSPYGEYKLVGNVHDTSDKEQWQ